MNANTNNEMVVHNENYVLPLIVILLSAFALRFDYHMAIIIPLIIYAVITSGTMFIMSSMMLYLVLDKLYGGADSKVIKVPWKSFGNIIHLSATISVIAVLTNSENVIDNIVGFGTLMMLTIDLISFTILRTIWNKRSKEYLNGTE